MQIIPVAMPTWELQSTNMASSHITTSYFEILINVIQLI